MSRVFSRLELAVSARPRADFLFFLLSDMIPHNRECDEQPVQRQEGGTAYRAACKGRLCSSVHVTVIQGHVRNHRRDFISTHGALQFQCIPTEGEHTATSRNIATRNHIFRLQHRRHQRRSFRSTHFPSATIQHLLDLCDRPMRLSPHRSGD